MKALFLGLGGIGQRHLRNLRLLVPEVGIAAVRHGGRRFEIKPDLSVDRDTDIIKKYDIAVYDSVDIAVATRPDFAIVATPSNTHAALAMQLVEEGIPVFVEKPAATARDEFTRLRDLAEKKGVAVMVGYMLRFDPAVRAFKTELQRGTVGQINSVQVTANTFMPGWHPYEDYRALYAARQELGGGVILTNIHLIDLLGWIFGRPTRLWCVGGRLSRYETDVEDVVAALLEYNLDGRSLPVSLDMSFVQRPVENSITVRGEDGYLTWNLADNSVVHETADGGSKKLHTTPKPDWNQLFVDELSHFIDCLTAGRANEAALEESAAGHSIAFAMKDSLASGAVVTC